MDNSFLYKTLNAKIAAVYCLLPSCDVFESRKNRDWESFDQLGDYEKLLVRKAEYESQINCSIDSYITQNKERLPYELIKTFQNLHYEQQRSNGRR